MNKIFVLIFSLVFIITSCIDIKKNPSNTSRTIIEISSKDYYKQYLENDITLHLSNDNEKMTGTFHVIDNNILKEVMILNNGLLNETNKIFYPNGSLAQETNYRKGIIFGEEKFYYKTGELKSTRKYSNNKKIGETVYYEKDGSLSPKYDDIDGKLYKDGVLIGKEYEFNHIEKGKLSVIKIYEGDGSKKVKIIMAMQESGDLGSNLIFILDEKHKIIDTINPEKNPEKFMILSQKIGLNLME